MSEKKTFTNDQLIGIDSVLKQIEISELNAKTTYWIGRNIRKLEPITSDFNKLLEGIRSDAWYKEYAAEMESKDDEKIKLAKEKFKDQVEEADKEVKEWGEKEVEFNFYTIKIENLELPNKFIPSLLDLISE